MDDQLEYFGEIIFDNVEDMSIELEGAYNFNENMKGIFNLMVILPYDGDDDTEILLTPGFQYKFKSGLIWAKADLSMYISNEYDFMDQVGLNLTFNAFRLRDKGTSPGPFGIELGLDLFMVSPVEDFSIFRYLYITPYHENKLFYTEIEFKFPLYFDGTGYNEIMGFEEEGMSITPLIDINILPVPGLALEFALPVTNIAADNDDDTIIGFMLGVKYSFN